MSDSWAVHGPEIRPQYLLWVSRQGPHREKLPAYLQGTGREVKGPSPGTQALSCQLPGKGRATVHVASTSILSCPGSSTVDLSAAPKDTCAQGSSPATAPNTKPRKQPRGSDTQETGRASAAAQIPEGQVILATLVMLYDLPPLLCPALRPTLFPGWAPNRTPSQLKSLPVRDPHSPHPGEAKPQLLSCHSRSCPTWSSPPFSSSLYASQSSWLTSTHVPVLPRNTFSHCDLSKSPLLQGPVQRPPPSGCFSHCPQPSFMFLCSSDPCGPIYPA